MCILEASAANVFTMRRWQFQFVLRDWPVIQCFQAVYECYSTELSEDDEVLSEASLMLDTEEVHPYLFEL